MYFSNSVSLIILSRVCVLFFIFLAILMYLSVLAPSPFTKLEIEQSRTRASSPPGRANICPRGWAYLALGTRLEIEAKTPRSSLSRHFSWVQKGREKYFKFFSNFFDTTAPSSVFKQVSHGKKGNCFFTSWWMVLRKVL